MVLGDSAASRVQVLREVVEAVGTQEVYMGAVWEYWFPYYLWPHGYCENEWRRSRLWDLELTTSPIYEDCYHKLGGTSGIFDVQEKGVTAYFLPYHLGASVNRA